MSIMPESGRLRIPISYIYYARIKCNTHGRLRIPTSYVYYARIKCNTHGRLRIPTSYVYYARIKCNTHGRLRIPYWSPYILTYTAKMQTHIKNALYATPRYAKLSRLGNRTTSTQSFEDISMLSSTIRMTSKRKETSNSTRYTPSRENVADLFTKPLPTTHHCELTRWII
jgi:hypothetical protein